MNPETVVSEIAVMYGSVSCSGRSVPKNDRAIGGSVCALESNSSHMQELATSRSTNQRTNVVEDNESALHVRRDHAENTVQSHDGGGDVEVHWRIQRLRQELPFRVVLAELETWDTKTGQMDTKHMSRAPGDTHRATRGSRECKIWNRHQHSQ